MKKILLTLATMAMLASPAMAQTATSQIGLLGIPFDVASGAIQFGAGVAQGAVKFGFGLVTLPFQAVAPQTTTVYTRNGYRVVYK